MAMNKNTKLALVAGGGLVLLTVAAVALSKPAKASGGGGTPSPGPINLPAGGATTNANQPNEPPSFPGLMGWGTGTGIVPGQSVQAALEVQAGGFAAGQEGLFTATVNSVSAGIVTATVTNVQDATGGGLTQAGIVNGAVVSAPMSAFVPV
jgi:hypothetical protein